MCGDVQKEACVVLRVVNSLLLFWHLRIPKDSTLLTHWRNRQLVPGPWMMQRTESGALRGL